MTETKKLLFITNSEFGQSSIVVSIIRELLSRQDPIEVHLLSFPPLRSRVADLLDDSSQSRFHFHPLTSALSYLQKSEEVGSLASLVRHRASVLGALWSYVQIASTLMPWTTDEYLKLYHECCQVIKEVQPNLCIVDTLFFQGLDACEGLDQRYIISCPTPWRGDQGSKLFTYPAVSSGFTFPVPTLLKPLNYFLIFSMIATFMFSPGWKKIEAARKQAGLTHPFPSFLVPKKVLTISASAPECDFPFDPNPELSLPVGPIVQPIQDLQKVDPELYDFISRKPTIMLALGSHVHTTEKMSIELSKGFKKVLEKIPDVQILWKVRKPHSSSKGDKLDFDPLENINRILGDELAKDRIRIVDWLKADPVSILATGHISCFVNHGGANSFFEGVYTGVPQVILACWYDTMENAAKAEYLGIGAFGNRRGAPDAQAEEFASSLLKVIGNEEMKKRALEVSEKSRKRGGAKAASDRILELAA